MIARLLAMLAGALAGLFMLSALAQTVAGEVEPDDVAQLGTEVDSFVRVMAATHGFDEDWLRRTLLQVQPSAGVQRAIAAPSTARPWHEFRPLFVDRARVENGLRFWAAHAALLARAREQFAVPEAVIVSIIGIETRYGRMTGGFSVLGALYTLAFHADNRPQFFRDELEQFLLLARDQGWDVTQPKGSYAGAMGWPQFMPSSYRRYAIDFDGDGKVDLWNSPADVIGSVANYLRTFGWQDGGPVAMPASVSGDPGPLVGLSLAPEFTVEQWRMRGVDVQGEVDAHLPAALFRLDMLDGPQFMLGFDNFHTILHYNRSRHYAMAVFELANELELERRRASGIEQPRTGTLAPLPARPPSRGGAPDAAHRAGALPLPDSAAQHEKVAGQRERHAGPGRGRPGVVLEQG